MWAGVRFAALAHLSFAVPKRHPFHTTGATAAAPLRAAAVPAAPRHAAELPGVSGPRRAIYGKSS